MIVNFVNRHNMTQRKAYAARLSETEAMVLDVAAGMWPEHKDKTSELLRQILADWGRIRKGQVDGSRAQTARYLRAICNHLGIDTEAIDHADQ